MTFLSTNVDNNKQMCNFVTSNRNEMAITISSSTIDKIKHLDSGLNKLAGWDTNDLSGFLNTLINSGSVEVGWREACGKTDRTMKVYREWIKVVKLLSKDGIVLKEDRQKHGNRYATNNGGFWNSIIYSLS